MNIKGANTFNLIAMATVFLAVGLLFITINAYTADSLLEEIKTNRAMLDAMMARHDAGAASDAKITSLINGMRDETATARLSMMPNIPGTVEGSGTVTEVHDADTILIDGEMFQTSLVNAPEGDENGAAEAWALASAACRVGSVAHYDIDDGQPMDAYGRNLAMIWCGGMDVSLNRLLLDTGHGAVLERYCGGSEFNGPLCGQ